jgi:capsular polysaccharide biosynthesis protein
MIRTLETELTESSEELQKLIKQNKSLTGKLTTSSDNLLEEKTKNSAKPSRVGDIILGFVIGFAFTFLIIFVLWFTSLFTETISDVYKEIFCTNALK